jgi:hypothetical protein
MDILLPGPSFDSAQDLSEAEGLKFLIYIDKRHILIDGSPVAPIVIGNQNCPEQLNIWWLWVFSQVYQGGIV